MKNKNLINKILLLVMSFQTVLLGVAFIIQVLRIYFGNEKTFTREICGQYILEILPIFILNSATSKSTTSKFSIFNSMFVKAFLLLILFSK